MAMQNTLNSFDGLVVNQSEINDRLEEIWEYLVSDKWLDSYANLTMFNIQVNSTKIDSEALGRLLESFQQDTKWIRCKQG